MPHSIEQPIRPDPTRRLPAHLRPTYPADTHEEAERIARQQREGQRQAAPAMGITRLDIPFWDVFCIALKFFVAQAIISAPFVVVIWIALTR